MAITDKTRKLLWGRSASRCGFCRVELAQEATEQSADAIIGDECHIVAKSPGGARYRGLPVSELDSYSNLLVLCRNHHKLIDDQPETFTEPVLRRLKSNHEHWVASTLKASSESVQGNQGNLRTRLRRLTTGADILELVAGADAYDFNHDSLKDEDEVALVGGFLQSAHDWGDIWDDIESRGHVEARFHLETQLRELRGYGFLVYGAETQRRMNAAGKGILLNVAMLRVLRTSNPSVPESHRTEGSVGDAAQPIVAGDNGPRSL